MEALDDDELPTEALELDEAKLLLDELLLDIELLLNELLPCELKFEELSDDSELDE